MKRDSSRQADVQEAEVEVTPEMVEAGKAELFEHRFGDPLDLVLEDVYRAMTYVARASASLTKSRR